MLLSACVVAVCIGIFCIQNPALAWWLYERDNAFMGITVTRPRRWSSYVYALGVFLIALGALGIQVALFG